MSNVDAERNELLSLALKQDVASGRSVIEWGGKQWEVRAPTMKMQRDTERKVKDPKTGEVDAYRQTVQLIMACTYVPGTEQTVFDPGIHERALMELPMVQTGLVTTLGNAIKTLMVPDQKEIAKNSEGTLSGSSSVE